MSINQGQSQGQSAGTVVSATNLDIRDLVFASDKVDASGTVLGAGTAAIGKLAANSGVDIGDVDITSIAAGDNNIGNVDIASIAAGDNNIGNVDVVTLPALAAGTNNIGDVDILSIAAGDNNIGNVDIVSGTVTTVSTVTALTGGGVAHDSADSGNPHKVGFKAFSPDGTTPGTAVAENDRSDAKCDLDGRLYVNPVHPVLWSYHLDTSTAQTDTSVKADPGDGFQIVVTSIIFSTGSATACNIFFEEGASKVLGPWYLEAVAGRGVVWNGHKPITASTALTVTTSASIAQSLDVCGYVQAV